MRGYGKVILFGEHAVVYGYPALAAGLATGISCKIGKRKENGFELIAPAWNMTANVDDNSPIAKAFRTIIQEFSETKKYCQLILQPEIPSKAGLGSSAATSVAIIKALASWYNIALTHERINEIAFKAESIFHGTPSGIDNTLATYGKLCYLCDDKKFTFPLGYEQKFAFKKLSAALFPSLKKSISLVIVNTKKERETKALVERVKALLEQNYSHYNTILSDIGNLSLKGYEALKQSDYHQLAKLMNKNHEYLKKIDVSCDELEEARSCVFAAGAIGAKLTGAGGGGCLIALAPGNEKEVVSYCKQKGFESFIADII